MEGEEAKRVKEVKGRGNMKRTFVGLENRLPVFLLLARFVSHLTRTISKPNGRNMERLKNIVVMRNETILILEREFEMVIKERFAFDVFFDADRIPGGEYVFLVLL